MKRIDKGKLYHKLHQLQKRIKRSLDNEGHTSELEMRKRLKRLLKLKKSIRRKK